MGSDVQGVSEEGESGAWQRSSGEGECRTCRMKRGAFDGWAAQGCRRVGEDVRRGKSCIREEKRTPGVRACDVEVEVDVKLGVEERCWSRADGVEHEV